MNPIFFHTQPLNNSATYTTVHLERSGFNVKFSFSRFYFTAKVSSPLYGICAHFQMYERMSVNPLNYMEFRLFSKFIF